MRHRLLLSAFCICVLCLSSPPLAHGTLPPEVRKQLSEIMKELRAVAPMIRRNEIDEAQEVIKQVEDRIAELNIAEDERDRTWSTVKSQLQKARAGIPVSFEAEVAPILKDNCLRCHGEGQGSSNLRMHTFSAMAAGGRNGSLARARAPLQSQIMARVMATNTQVRMPKGRPKLSDADINIIGRWIQQGLKFDGEDRNAPIGDSLVVKKPPVKVVMADGSETISFKNDVAPWMVTICMGCHSGNNPRSGYSMTTFELLLTDGDTGSTIVPGKADDSYICDLVLRQDPVKMPAGQALLKRSQANALEKWINEGAHFDGGDPKAPLRDLVPTPAEIAAAQLASMTDKEFTARRLEQAESNWKRVSPRESAQAVTTENLIVYGSAGNKRLAEIADWGEEQVKVLTERYQLPSGEKPWRGKLIVFVTKDRFDYEEFNSVLMNGRRTPPSVSAHVVITAGADQAYVAMHDVGDVSSADAQSAKDLLNAQLAEAYLVRDGSNLPDWLRQGFGIMESGMAPNSEFTRNIPARAGQALSTVSSPATLFDDGTFGPAEVGAVGYLLVKYLSSKGGTPKMQQLVQALRTNGNVGRAIQQVYKASAANLGTAFLQSGGR
jgi:cytochrome c553